MLQSFWPGLQALYGDLQPAAGFPSLLTFFIHLPHHAPATLDAMLAIMHRYKFVPEAYNLNTKKVEKGMGQYPLRCEIIPNFSVIALPHLDIPDQAGGCRVLILLVPSNGQRGVSRGWARDGRAPSPLLPIAVQRLISYRSITSTRTREHVVALLLWRTWRRRRNRCETTWTPTSWRKH